MSVPSQDNRSARPTPSLYVCCVLLLAAALLAVSPARTAQPADAQRLPPGSRSSSAGNVLLGADSFAGETLSIAPPRQERARIRTDHRAYPKPPLPMLPRAGGKFIDPVFGTEIMRATDEADGPAPGLGTYYSHWPTFNLDNTKLLIRKGETGNAVIKEFDPETFTIKKGSVALPQSLPGGGGPQWESATWSNLDPNVIYTFPNYYDGGMKLYSYNVTARSFRLIKDFRSLSGGPKDYLRQMYVSSDDDTFCWLQVREGSNGNGPVAYIVYRRSTDTVLFHNPSSAYAGGINEVHVDKSGKWLTIHLNQKQPDNTHTLVLNLRTGAVDALKWDAKDSPPGHGDLGTETIVGADSFAGGINKRRLDRSHSPLVILRFETEQGKTDWTFGQHGTMYADDESWLTVGTFNDPSVTLPEYHLFDDEIIQVATDGSRRVRRICHTRSAIDNKTKTSGYTAMPKPTISRDGRFIAFTSNWEKSGRYDLFIARIDPAPPLSNAPTNAPAPARRERRTRPSR